MDSADFQICSGVFILLVALGFTVSQIGISKLFGYPGILRQETRTVLQEYNRLRKKIRPFWALFAFSSVMLIGLAAVFYRLLNGAHTPYLIVGTFFGAAAGVFYVLGIMRWVLLADSLSSQYMSTDSSAQKKELVVTVFEAFHVYCGNSIGETMGFFCTGIWIAITGFAVMASSILPWELGLGFIITGIGVGVAPLEWAGIAISNRINKISMKIFMILLAVCGILLIAGA